MPKKRFADLRVAIVADWLTSFGGAERVLAAFTRIFLRADVYTTVYTPALKRQFLGHRIFASGLQKLPLFLRKRHQMFLPFLPGAIENLNLNDYDLVLSSSSFVAKGCLTNPATLHICYCHTPTRYLWDDWQKYIQEFPLPFGLNFVKKFLPKMASKLRQWDAIAAMRPDLLLANSHFIAEKIAQYYRRESIVVSPPVDFERFAQGIQESKQNFFLAAGRFTPYKRFDLLIETFRALPKLHLKIAGTGPDLMRLKYLAQDAKNIEFIGFVEESKLPTLFGQAQAFLFPQIEDAGISLLEALAAGTPVIALRKGGALEIVCDGENGIFFEEQTADALAQALKKFEKSSFDRSKIQASVQNFSVQNFEKKVHKYCQKAWQEFSGYMK